MFLGPNYSQHGNNALPMVNNFKANMERMLNNMRTHPLFQFNMINMLNMLMYRANMKPMLIMINLEIIPEFKTYMERMLNTINSETNPYIRANMKNMLNMLIQNIIPQFIADMETVILNQISLQFRANMAPMLNMLYQENYSNPEYGYNMLSWITALSSEFAQDYWTRLQNFVKSEREKHPRDIFPPKEEVFTWMKYCPPDQIKVVIIGQDPYPNPGEAHGLCFSVKRPVPPPASLKNIFKELRRDVGFVNPGHGDLTNWAKQGVLLLNAVLTVRSREATVRSQFDHKGEGWEEFTNRVVSLVSERNSGVVFLLWGNDAQQKRPWINEGRHRILPTSHPSPLSAHRGFDGCGHFSKTNELLLGQWKDPIDWQI